MLDRPFEQRFVPFPGGAGLLVKIVKLTTIPNAALDMELGPVGADGNGIGSIGLQLNSVNASIGGSVTRAKARRSSPLWFPESSAMR